MRRFSALQKVLWLALAVAAGGAICVHQRQPAAQTESSASFRPEIALADAEGERRHSSEFRGQYLLVFFGFTNCPDVCPTTLIDVAQVMDDLGEDAARVQPLFISIDPERDRRLGLAEFSTAFHPSILGLAGTAEETRAAAESFKIFFDRQDDARPPMATACRIARPCIWSTRKGNWIKQFSYGTPAAEILADLHRDCER